MCINLQLKNKIKCLQKQVVFHDYVRVEAAGGKEWKIIMKEIDFLIEKLDSSLDNLLIMENLRKVKNLIYKNDKLSYAEKVDYLTKIDNIACNHHLPF